jgi:aryl-alcohol dehydrogenase-like predicted oxidoreductase
MDLTTLAIRFALDTSALDIVLVGVSDRSELAVAVEAAGRRPLTPEQYAAVAAFDRSDAPWSHPERWPEGTIA